jgi:hypothetical protein
MNMNHNITDMWNPALVDALATRMGQTHMYAQKSARAEMLCSVQQQMTTTQGRNGRLPIFAQLSSIGDDN